jgi:hypothetical protein
VRSALRLRTIAATRVWTGTDPAVAVMAPAKCDPRIAVADWPPSPEILDVIEEWLNGDVELDPDGFLSLADLRKTLPQPVNGIVARQTKRWKRAASPTVVRPTSVASMA